MYPPVSLNQQERRGVLGEKEGDLLFLFFGKEVMNNGGGGLLGIYIGGVCTVHIKGGGLRCGNNPKGGS